MPEQWPGEPDFTALRERVRRWVQYYFRRCEAAGVDRKGFAEFLGFEPPTISNLLNEKELPGLLCFYRMHFRFGVDPKEMLRFDPPSGATVIPLQLPTPAQVSAQEKRTARK